MNAPVMISATLHVDARCWLGESPLWDDRSNDLLWVDIEAGRVLRLSSASAERTVTQIDEPIGAIALHDDGYVAAVKSGFLRLTTALRPVGTVVPVRHERRGMRMNDGNVDPFGSFWAGSMEWDGGSGIGSLYRLGADGTVRRLLDGLTISNGLDWDASATRMYFVDSAESQISLFDVGRGCRTISNRRTFVEINPALGSPDGLTVDAEDGVWVALWGSGRVHGYTSDGQLGTVISVPTPHVTSCVFGGRDLRTLFITTARKGLGRPDDYAGGVFVAQVPSQGRLANRCSVGPD